MPTLSDETLQHTRTRTLGERELTLDQAGADTSVDDFAATLKGLRKRLRESISSLPDNAFTEQQVGEGKEVWAAGQVVAHLSNSTHSMSSQVRPLLGMPPADAPAPHDLTLRPSREEALVILDESNQVLESFLNTIPRGADMTVTQEHPRFGTIGPRGWLMLMAIHEEGHLRQVEALR